MPRFTVLIPTHEHTDTLPFALASLLGQTVQDFEVFIVGDGAPAKTAEAVAALARRDDRFRYFDNPKGERHGEAHRHQALQEARGECVAYLTDDDLWLPDHLAALAEALAGRDFAHTLEVIVPPDGAPFGWLTDASGPDAAEAMRRRVGGIGLPCAGHTLAAYRRLPHGWRPAPRGVHTDHHFFLQFLEQSWCRAASLPRPTAVHFPSPARRGWTMTERVAELAAWSARLTDPARRLELARAVLEPLVLQAHREAVRRGQALASLACPAPQWPPPLRPCPRGVEIGFGASDAGVPYLLHGFSRPESWGVWTDGDEAALGFPLERPLGNAVVLRLHHGGLVHPQRHPVSRVGLAVNGVPVADWIWMRADESEVRDIALPASLAGVAWLTLSFRLYDPACPCELGIGEDGRRLALSLVSLQLTPAA